jgi:hypothetical protein
MAILGPWTNAQVIVNGVDLSNRVASVEVMTGKADQEVTAMGAYGKSRRPGLADEGFKIKFRQDFALSNVDATLAPLYLNGTAVAVEVRPVNGARSTTNPAYVANACYLLDYPPMTGDIGNPLDTECTFSVDGQTTGIQRLTA